MNNATSTNLLSRVTYLIGGVMVRRTHLECVDRGLELRSGQTKGYVSGTCCFSAKHTTLRRNSKDWSARNQNNVTE